MPSLKTLLKRHVVVITFILIIISIIVTTVILNTKTDTDTRSDASSHDSADLPFYGKGLIFYTENYVKNFEEGYAGFNLPVPDSAVTELANMHIEGTECSRYFDMRQKDIEHFKELGLDYVIVGFGPASWYNIAPTRPAHPTNPDDPAYKFSKLDEWIQKLENNNINVVLQLWGTPTWASGVASPRSAYTGSQTRDCQQTKREEGDGRNTYDPSSFFKPYNAPPLQVEDYANFVEAVVRRYGERIEAYSLWNEPNITAFWEGSLENFIALNNIAYNRIKNINQNSVVWGPNLLGTYSDTGLYPHTFMQRSGGRLKFDVFALHAYPHNFNESPRMLGDQQNEAIISIGNLQNAFSILDTSGYEGKPVAITEMGYRSNWERQFGASGIREDLSERLKGLYTLDSLAEVDEVLAHPEYGSRLVAVSNNTLYNNWRWWSTGLVNVFNTRTSKLDFNQKLDAYFVYKNWKPGLKVAANDSSEPPFSQVDAVYPDKNGYTVIHGNHYWYRPANTDTWFQNTLKSAYGERGNVPLQDIDTAYFDPKMGYTVIQSDRYWYRATPQSDWHSNTLATAYARLSGEKSKAPASNLDAAYFDAKGGYTIIQGDRYWYRESSREEWYSNTLRSAYYNESSNAEEVAVPYTDIHSAYFEADGGYTVIKGEYFWYRPTPQSAWVKGTLKQLFSFRS